PYVECSTPDGKNQLQVCKDKGVQSYPTWIFSDGSQQTGEVPLKMLSDKTGCALPGEESSEVMPLEPSAASPAVPTDAE
ncbi:MAG: hypothetical protein AAB923_03305, partial [Patescibacteria group bacterium]